jgi:hypothetical protein
MLRDLIVIAMVLGKGLRDGEESTMYILNPVQSLKVVIERIPHKRAMAHQRLEKTHSGCLIYTIRSFGAMSGPSRRPTTTNTGDESGCVCSWLQRSKWWSIDGR